MSAAARAAAGALYMRRMRQGGKLPRKEFEAQRAAAALRREREIKELLNRSNPTMEVGDGFQR